MTIKELDHKYHFNRRELAQNTKLSYPTVIAFFGAGLTKFSSIKKITNALPISSVERHEFINTLFAKE